MQSEDPYTMVANILSNSFGSELVGRLESVIIAAKSIKLSKDVLILDSSRRLGKLLQVVINDYLQSLITIGSRVLSDSTAFLYKGITALIFSLIITWDLPQIQKGVNSLENSRVGFAYKEIAPKLRSFGNLVAQSFEVQAMIAFVNCVLTTIGLYFLKIPGLGFFSLLTLISSFIPVAGIFIATLPPLLVALAEYGISSGVQLLAMVTFVHAVESYLLYPQIFIHKIIVIIITRRAHEVKWMNFSR
jgi:predicted PurR-regulated permease PerM